MQGGTVGGSCRGWFMNSSNYWWLLYRLDRASSAFLVLLHISPDTGAVCGTCQMQASVLFAIPWGSSDPHDVSGSPTCICCWVSYNHMLLTHILMSVYHPTLMQSDMQGGCVVWLLKGRDCFLAVARSCRLCSLHPCQFPYGCAHAHLEIYASPWVLLSARLLETCCPWHVIAWRSCRCS
jgi:hypothetical protein